MSLARIDLLQVLVATLLFSGEILRTNVRAVEFSRLDSVHPDGDRPTTPDRTRSEGSHTEVPGSRG